MTRNEAIKKLYERSNEPVGLGADWASFEVDKYVALGILKLDEPKDATEKFKDALINQGWSPQGVDDALRQAGVKIVEK